jgi:mRNA export factor
MSSFGQSSDTLGLDLSKDATLTSPPGDTISSLSWSSKADYLGVGSWDHKVRIYDMTSVPTGEGRAMIDFDGPVLSCDWSVVSRSRTYRSSMLTSTN